MASNGRHDGLGHGDHAEPGLPTKEPVSRRKKLAGYLRAANEIRHSYFNPDSSHQVGEESSTEEPETIVRNGNEEMILFPSYARHHTKREIPDVKNSDYWTSQWDKRRGIDNAIVDVDVRGWVYTPHKGQASRRQRLLIGLARQLSAIPAPNTRSGDPSYSNATPSRSSSPTGTKQEEDLIALEAEQIVRQHDREVRYARRGAFSEDPRHGSDVDDLFAPPSRSSSPERGRQGSASSRISRFSVLSDGNYDAGLATPSIKRASWTHPSQMSAAELAEANSRLMSRLKPFMANPLASAPVRISFYNDSSSQQQTVITNASGHFACRAPLDFVPMHVRVLAGDNLSATEAVHVTPARGVSMISDIDDTIKHSAISSGAREIFRNAFVRSLSDLTIEGVREWYTALHDMGVELHYVSNSPWQMYPVLTSFFRIAHLPTGSFHLKQYTGMLQGIFEPVAERKKASLEKIMNDFPLRKFILVGDSGEADLEVYTDVALAHAGRILGIFIRDVTTPTQSSYFGPEVIGAAGPVRHHSRQRSGDTLMVFKKWSPHLAARDEDPELKAALEASLEDMDRQPNVQVMKANIPRQAQDSGYVHGHARRPPLARRESPGHVVPSARLTTSPEEEDLIDFTDEKPNRNKGMLEAPSHQQTPKSATVDGSRKSTLSPSPPPKPSAFRLPSPHPRAQTDAPENAHKTPPPRPRKPSTSVKRPLPQPSDDQDRPLRSTDQAPARTANPPSPKWPHHVKTIRPSPLSQETRQRSPARRGPPLPERPKTMRAITSEAFHNVYNSLPSKARPPPRSVAADQMSSVSSTSNPSSDDNFHSTSSRKLAPPLPRRTVSSFPMPSSRRGPTRPYVGGGGEEGEPVSPVLSPSESGMPKKEFLWKQRWRLASEKLESAGVLLRSWRVGDDVRLECMQLVESELHSMDEEDDRLHD